MATTFDATLKDMGRDSPEGFLAELSLEDGLTSVAQRGVAHVTREAPPDRAKKLLTDAFLLTGLRVRRDVAERIFKGIRAMEESDTFLWIIDQGQEKHAKKTVLLLGGKKLGPADESVRARLDGIKDLERLDRMILQAITAASWQEILDTP